MADLSTLPPELKFYRAELQSALDENSEAIKSYEILPADGSDNNSEVDGGLGCRARIVTLDELELIVKIQNEGYRLVSPSTNQLYDTLDSLLINHSPAYVVKVNEAITKQLNAFIERSGDGPDQHRFVEVEEES